MVENLVPQDPNHVIRLLRRDRVDQHVTMNADEVFGVQDAVFVLRGTSGDRSLQQAALGHRHPGLSAYLTRRVDYFSREVFTSVLDDFAEGVLNRRVIALHKVSVHELHRQRGFACSNQFPRGRVQLRSSSPTDRLPTMAIFRCFGGAGIAAIVQSSLSLLEGFPKTNSRCSLNG